MNDSGPVQNSNIFPIEALVTLSRSRIKWEREHFWRWRFDNFSIFHTLVSDHVMHCLISLFADQSMRKMFCDRMESSTHSITCPVYIQKKPLWSDFRMPLKNAFGKCSLIFFISQWIKRSKHGLFVFPPKKTLIWRRHCSIGQSCCSVTSKRSIGWFLESYRAWSFFTRAFI